MVVYRVISAQSLQQLRLEKNISALVEHALKQICMYVCMHVCEISKNSKTGKLQCVGFSTHFFLLQ